MKNLPTFAEKPEMLDEGGYFEELLKAAEYESLTREEKRKYLKTVQMRGDYQNTIDFAREQGFIEGTERRTHDIAVSLKEAGVDVSVIATATGLSVDEIMVLSIPSK